MSFINLRGVIFTIILITCCVVSVDSKTKKKERKVLAKDLPYIACDVCENTIQELYTKVTDLRKTAPYNKLEEIQVLEEIEAVCKDDVSAGEWIRRLDIVEKKEKGKSTLALDEPGGFSKCESECATISLSCNNLLEEELDLDELSALLWKGKGSMSEIKNKVCQKMTKRCPNKKFLPSKTKREDYPFVPMKEKDLEMEQLMAKMKASGMGGMSMYNREDMEDMAGGGGYGAGDMDDEDLGGDPYGDMGAYAGGAPGGYDGAGRGGASSDYEF
eukprot:gene8351-17207_t